MGSSSAAVLHRFVRLLIETALFDRRRVAHGPPGFLPAAFVLRGLAWVWLLTTIACGGPRASAVRPAGFDRDVLTRDEILDSNARQGNLYEAIRSLRPRFFMTDPSVHSAGSMASMPVAVYFGRLRQAGLETLRTIAADNVEQVRYLDPTASQNEFGPMASGGALIVVLRDPSKLPDTAVSTIDGRSR